MGGNHTAKHPSVSFGVGVLEIRMPKNLTKKSNLTFARIVGGHAGEFGRFATGGKGRPR